MVGFTIKDSLKAKILIAETGNTLKSFSELAGISYSYMSRIIAGKNSPSVIVATKITKALGVTIDELFNIDYKEVK